MFSTRKRMLAPMMAVALATSLSACSDDSAGPETGADVEDVAEDENAVEDEPLDEEPAAEGANDSLLGQTVTVSAEIEEVVTPGAIRIGEQDLLVLSAGPTFADMGFEVSEGLVDDDVIVQATGTVAQLVFPDIEDEFGFDWDDEALAEFEGENVLVSSQIDTLPGEPVTIAGEVSQVISTVSFQLEGAGWQVVVLDAQQAAVDEGAFVQVEGTVRELNIAELEEEFGLDLDDELYADFEGDLVLVAETVTESAPATP